MCLDRVFDLLDVVGPLVQKSDLVVVELGVVPQIRREFS
jgi:hypothetical protein